jgi:carbon storage regulator
MLVLSRKPGEEIIIGDSIRLTILEIRGKQIRIGLTAPAGVRIYRSELCVSDKDLDPATDRPPPVEESS